MMIRNSLFAAVALLMTGCGIYKPYTRPEVTTDGIYRETRNSDRHGLAGRPRLAGALPRRAVAAAHRYGAGTQHRSAHGTVAGRGGRSDAPHCTALAAPLLHARTPGRRKQFRQFEGDLDLQPSRDGQLGDRYFLAAAQRQTPQQGALLPEHRVSPGRSHAVDRHDGQPLLHALYARRTIRHRQRDRLGMA